MAYLSDDDEGIAVTYTPRYSITTDIPLHWLSGSSAYLYDVWDVGSILRYRDVWHALEAQDLEREMFDPIEMPHVGISWHARRVAYLVDHPDEWAPVLVNANDNFPLVDGHHRYAAAVYLRHETIRGVVYGEGAQSFATDGPSLSTWAWR